MHRAVAGRRDEHTGKQADAAGLTRARYRSMTAMMLLAIASPAAPSGSGRAKTLSIAAPTRSADPGAVDCRHVLGGRRLLVLEQARDDGVADAPLEVEHDLAAAIVGEAREGRQESGR